MVGGALLVPVEHRVRPPLQVSFFAFLEPCLSDDGCLRCHPYTFRWFPLLRLDTGEGMPPRMRAGGDVRELEFLPVFS